jgi:hypothetical protein
MVLTFTAHMSRERVELLRVRGHPVRGTGSGVANRMAVGVSITLVASPEFLDGVL